MDQYLSRKIKIVSFFAICFVILQHAINFTGYIDPSSMYIGTRSVNALFQYVVGYGFARPAVAIFFILSGYLFFRNFTLVKTVAKIKSRFRSLCVPYILWSALGVLFIVILQSTPLLAGGLQSFYTGNLVGKTLGEYIHIVLNHGVSFQLWFLVDLMLYTLLAPVFYIILRSSSILFIVPLYILWILQIPLPPLFSFIYRGGLFYLLGAYIALYGVYIPKEKTKPITLVSFLFWVVMLGIKTSVAFGVISSQWMKLSQIDNIAILMGITTLWFGYDKIASSKMMDVFYRLTPCTFFLYAAHEPLLEVVKQLGVLVTGRGDVSMMILYGATVLAVLGITIGCGAIVKRTAPTLYSLLTGGR